MARSLILLYFILAAVPATADWVVFTDGGRTRVLGVEFAERAVHITTLAGKKWSVQRSIVDVDETYRANGMTPPSERLEVVRIETPREMPAPIAAPERARSVAPPPQQTPPPPQTIIERERTPVPPTTDVLPTMPSTGARQHRFSFSLNGVAGTDSVQFSERNDFVLFKEPAQIESLYRGPRTQGYEVAAQYRVAGPFAIGGAAQLFQEDREVAFTASLPHPFFFDRFRELSGSQPGLSHEELAIHLDAFFTKTWGPVTIDVFGGPSWFSTRTELLVDVLYDESFPFDTVAFRGVEARVLENQPIGFNVGGTATFRIAGVFGIDFRVRYSEARSKLFVEEGREIELDVGALQLGAGLRFLFP